MNELGEIPAAIPDYRTRDDRAEPIDKPSGQHAGVKLTSFYVGYLLPMTVEVPHFAYG